MWNVWQDAKGKSIEAEPTEALSREKERTLQVVKDAFVDTIQEAEDGKAKVEVSKKKARKTKLEKLQSGLNDGKVLKVEAKKHTKENLPKIEVEFMKGGRQKTNNTKSIKGKVENVDSDRKEGKKGSGTNAKVSTRN